MKLAPQALVLLMLLHVALWACTRGAPGAKHSGDSPAETTTQSENNPEMDKNESVEKKALPAHAFELETQHTAFGAFRQNMPEQTKVVCKRNAGKTNVLINAICNGQQPTSLNNLQVMLGIDPLQSKFVFTGHSSSLVARNTSAINPRLILFRIDAQDDNFVTMGFVRGEQFVEIIVNNGAPNTPDFFLGVFKQACNDQPKGCSIGELLTPAVESNWTGFTLYQDEDLKNNVLDCKQCHQPEGLASQKILRMQELRNPWTHFFRDSTESKTLIDDFEAAHGTDETYGGVPGSRIRNGSDPADLERFVKDNGFETQPNEFMTQLIRDEINATPGQPVDNTTPGKSATWDQLYDKYRKGEMIATPYHDVKVTDPLLLAKFTKQYQDFRAGIIKAEDMLDHRPIFKPDPIQKADMGFGVRPDEPVEVILQQACAQCHNSKLDQSIKRANFNVDIEAMVKKLGGPLEAAEELSVAIARVNLGLSLDVLPNHVIITDKEGKPTLPSERGAHIKTMPPKLFRDLTDAQIKLLTTYFEEQRQRLINQQKQK